MSPTTYYTPEQYLALEEAAEYKSEYFAGQIFAMAGASEDHNTINVNVSSDLRRQLLGRPCRVYASDMRVWVSETGLYTYPDTLAFCGERQFEDAKRRTLLNPTVITCSSRRTSRACSIVSGRATGSGSCPWRKTRELLFSSPRSASR